MIIELADDEVIMGRGTRGGARVYHTDPKCDSAGQLEKPEIKKKPMVRGKNHCRFCSGEAKPRGEQVTQTDFLKELGLIG